MTRFPWMFNEKMTGPKQAEKNRNIAYSYYSGRFDLVGIIKEIGVDEVEKVIEKVKNGSI